MLLLPELFVPKRPVMGASRIASTDFHNLKFLRVSSLSMVVHPRYCNSVACT